MLALASLLFSVDGCVIDHHVLVVHVFAETGISE
jgi:hypothetical protein